MRRDAGALLVVAAMFLWNGCETDAKPALNDRGTHRPLIIEAVLRCGVQEFAKSDGSDGALCLGVRDAGPVVDPAPSMLMNLNRAGVQPMSSCKATRTLIVGPIEWLRDDEVRVKADYAMASGRTRPLAYRVVREDERWVCVGPILSVDPL